MATQNVETGVVYKLGVPKVISNKTIRYSLDDFLFDFNRNCVYLVLSYLSNVTDFNLPHLHLATPFGMISFKIFGIRKLTIL